MSKRRRVVTDPRNDFRLRRGVTYRSVVRADGLENLGFSRRGRRPEASPRRANRVRGESVEHVGRCCFVEHDSAWHGSIGEAAQQCDGASAISGGAKRPVAPWGQAVRGGIAFLSMWSSGDTRSW